MGIAGNIDIGIESVIQQNQFLGLFQRRDIPLLDDLIKDFKQPDVTIINHIVFVQIDNQAVLSKQLVELADVILIDDATVVEID